MAIGSIPSSARIWAERDRMGDVRLARRPQLAPVRLDGQGEGPLDRSGPPAGGARDGGEQPGASSVSRSRSAGRCARPGPGAAAGTRGATRAAVRRRRDRPAYGAAAMVAQSTARSRAGRRPGDQPVQPERRRARPRPRPRSSHGIGAVRPDDRRSWPLPASRTVSPGRARRRPSRIAAGRSAIDGAGPRPRRPPAASRPGAIAVEDRLAVLAPGVLVGDDDQPAAFAGDAAHQRTLGRVALPGRPEDGDQAPTPRGGERRELVEARSRATPGLCA